MSSHHDVSVGCPRSWLIWPDAHCFPAEVFGSETDLLRSRQHTPYRLHGLHPAPPPTGADSFLRIGSYSHVAKPFLLSRLKANPSSFEMPFPMNTGREMLLWGKGHVRWGVATHTHEHTYKYDYFKVSFPPYFPIACKLYIF